MRYAKLAFAFLGFAVPLLALISAIGKVPVRQVTNRAMHWLWSTEGSRISSARLALFKQAVDPVGNSGSSGGSKSDHHASRYCRNAP